MPATTTSRGCRNDRVHGGRHGDILFGGAGDDVLWGGRGSDIIQGQTGKNVIRAGPGDDEVSDDFGVGRDRFFLGPGIDLVLMSNDGLPDLVDCGSGYDSALFSGDLDPLDEF